jgi:hypothetical protein
VGCHLHMHQKLQCSKHCSTTNIAVQSTYDECDGRAAHQMACSLYVCCMYAHVQGSGMKHDECSGKAAWDAYSSHTDAHQHHSERQITVGQASPACMRSFACKANLPRVSQHVFSASVLLLVTSNYDGT